MIPRNLITMTAMSIKSWKKPKKFLYKLTQKETFPRLNCFSVAVHSFMKHNLMLSRCFLWMSNHLVFWGQSSRRKEAFTKQQWETIAEENGYWAGPATLTHPYSWVRLTENEKEKEEKKRGGSEWKMISGQIITWYFLTHNQV